MSKPKILLQFDSDRHASAFDAVTAIDAGIDHLQQYHALTPADVRGLVHGAMFTRGPQDLKHTAIFIGGSNVAIGEELLEKTTACFFGPMRVSVMLDANGANTTAAAAVLAAEKHCPLAGASALVLAGTGPVGQRAARLLAGQGVKVRLASRLLARSEEACRAVRAVEKQGELTPVETADRASLITALEGVSIVIAAGAAGVELLSDEIRRSLKQARVLIDLNAVPPEGIGGIAVTDKTTERDGAICYGAIGVGGLKMKIHKAAIASLFESNNRVLDAEEIYEIGRKLA